MIDIDDRARALAHSEGLTFAIVGIVAPDGEVALGFGSGVAGMNVKTILVSAQGVITLARQMVGVAAVHVGCSEADLWDTVCRAQRLEFQQTDRAAKWRVEKIGGDVCTGS